MFVGGKYSVVFVLFLFFQQRYIFPKTLFVSFVARVISLIGSNTRIDLTCPVYRTNIKSFMKNPPGHQFVVNTSWLDDMRC